MPPPPQSPYGGGYAPQAYTAQPVYGGFWIRFVAIVIDGIIIAIPIIVVAVIVGATIGFTSASQNATTQQTNAAANGATGIVQLLAIVIQAGYFIYFWSRGQTLGMRLFRLRVVDANTYQPISVGKAVVRFIGYYISALVCYIGLIWAAFDGRKQGWHDKIAGTVVLQG